MSQVTVNRRYIIQVTAAAICQLWCEQLEYQGMKQGGKFET